MAVMSTICKKVAAPTANPNGPHNNIIGADYTRHTNGSDKCPFCGSDNVPNNAFLCGFAGQPYGPVSKQTHGKVILCCGRTATSFPAKVSPLAAAVSSAKPLINCPSCGAYGADKHRRGCKINLSV